MIRTRAALVGVALFLLALLPATLRAQDNPFQIAFIGPTMQLVDDDEDVRGVRINILYGVNQNMSGLDLGLINRTSGTMTGVGFGVANVADGGFAGWQAGLVNIAKEQFTGLQWSPGSIGSLVNVAEDGEGAQIAWVYNEARNLSGFQLSLVNVADDLYGLQIGLVNIIRSKDEFPILPIVNWKFEE